MWFFRSIELLPRPSFVGVAPALAMLVTWILFEGTRPEIFGRPVLPLWIALVAMFALHFAARLPISLAHIRETGMKNGPVALWRTVAVIVVVLAAGLFVQNPWVLQLGWLVSWLLYEVAIVGGLLLLDKDDLADMPLRWAGDHPFAREAIWILAVRNAVVAVGASWLMSRGTLTDWVLFLTLGRFVLFYLFEWITILFAITWHDEEN